MGKMLDKAIKMAVDAHSEQRRKGTDLPYIVHPMEACAIVAAMTDDEEVLAAAMLHDVIEDTEITEEELRAEFGDRVTELVLAESENKRVGQAEEDTWKVRKTETIEFLRNQANREEKMIALGDKLANLRSIKRDLDKMGEEVWRKFHEKDPKEHEWYYREIGKALENEFSGETRFEEFRGLMDEVWGKSGNMVY